MTTRYDYCCKCCWHTWRSEKRFTQCPKCGSVELDVQSEEVL